MTQRVKPRENLSKTERIMCLNGLSERAGPRLAKPKDSEAVCSGILKLGGRDVFRIFAEEAFGEPGRASTLSLGSMPKAHPTVVASIEVLVLAAQMLCISMGYPRWP